MVIDQRVVIRELSKEEGGGYFAVMEPWPKTICADGKTPQDALENLLQLYEHLMPRIDLSGECQ